MQIFFATAISNIQVSQDLGRGDKLDESTFVTNSPEAFAQEVAQPEFKIHAGTVEAEYLVNAPLVAYSREEVASCENAQEVLIGKLRLVSLFLMYCWVVKDNAANCDTGFLVRRGKGQVTTDTNVMALKYSTALGSADLVSFTRDELRHARELVRHSFPLEAEVQGKLAALKQEDRLSRAFYFCQSARAETDLGLKIAHYCTVLEALLATSSSELAHQLAERVALLLGNDKEERLEAFRKTKRAYRTRSRVVHGAHIGGEDLEESAQFLDNAVRRILWKAYTEEPIHALFKLSNEKLDEAFLGKLFC